MISLDFLAGWTSAIDFSADLFQSNRRCSRKELAFTVMLSRPSTWRLILARNRTIQFYCTQGRRSDKNWIIQRICHPFHTNHVYFSTTVLTCSCFGSLNKPMQYSGVKEIYKQIRLSQFSAFHSIMGTKLLSLSD